MCQCAQRFLTTAFEALHGVCVVLHTRGRDPERGRVRRHAWGPRRRLARPLPPLLGHAELAERCHSATTIRRPPQHQFTPRRRGRRAARRGNHIQTRAAPLPRRGHPRFSVPGVRRREQCPHKAARRLVRCGGARFCRGPAALRDGLRASARGAGRANTLRRELGRRNPTLAAAPRLPGRQPRAAHAPRATRTRTLSPLRAPTACSVASTRCAKSSEARRSRWPCSRPTPTRARRRCAPR